MKTCSILFWIFLFRVTVARTMTEGEIEATSNPSFIWKTPIALHVVYPNGQEDYIHLEPVIMSGAPVKCLFRGQFYRDKSSSAVISGCMEDDKVSITIVAKELWGRTAFEVTKGMVEEVENPYALNVSEDYDEDEDKNDDQVDRDKRSVYIYEEYQENDYTEAQYDGGANFVDPPPLLTTPLKLAFDKSFMTKMGSEEAAKTYIRSVAELGSLYLENFSPQTKIFLNIVDEIEFFDEILEPNTKKLHRAYKLKTKEAVPLVIFTSKADNNERMGISAGLPGKACHEEKGVSIVKHRSNKNLAAMTFGHELGHEHGMKHDRAEKPPCSGEGLMSVIGPHLSLSQRPTTFSSCSVARFATWYGNKFGDCMEEGIVNKASKLKYLESKLENLEDKCSSLTASPGATLKSGCEKPDQLQDGAWTCSQDGSSCHAACHEGFKSNKNTIVVCDQSTWIPNPNSFLCVPLPELPDEVIFITGGRGAFTSSELVDVAPSGGGCGKVTSQLPASKYFHSMDLLNGKLVICGGFDTETSCIAASSPSGPWSDHSTTTGRRMGHGSSAVGGSIYLIGGYDSASMEVLEGNRWITKPNPPAHFGLGTCATNIGDNQILVIGGRGSYNKVARYRVEEDEWEELADLPAGSGRNGHGCVFLGDGQVLVGGGHDGSSKLSSCGIYHIGEGRWEEVGDMKSRRYGVRFLAVSVAGKRRFYALGGYDGSNRLDSIEEFDQETKTWSVSPVRIAAGRSYFGAVVMKRANVC